MEKVDEHFRKNEKYVSYLIQDLEEVSKQEPITDYYETPPGYEEHEDIVELALSPFKSIEEFTGIPEEAFPDVFDISMDMIERLNEAIFKVYQWLHLELVDQPKDITADVLYHALRFNWDMKVQYLPSTGMDVEFCTGEMEDCIYGEFCDYCNTEFSDKDS